MFSSIICVLLSSLALATPPPPTSRDPRICHASIENGTLSVTNFQGKVFQHNDKSKIPELLNIWYPGHKVTTSFEFGSGIEHTNGSPFAYWKSKDPNYPLVDAGSVIINPYGIVDSTNTVGNYLPHQGSWDGSVANVYHIITTEAYYSIQMAGKSTPVVVTINIPGESTMGNQRITGGLCV